MSRRVGQPVEFPIAGGTGARYHLELYFVCGDLPDLASILDRYGNRRYGLVQLESALFAGRLHLAAHAVGLRAVGSTSLDDEVVEFFSPRAAGRSSMFVTVFGVRRRPV